MAGEADSNIFGALDKKKIVRSIYDYITKKMLDAYNDGELDFFIGNKMLIRDLGMEISHGGTFTFAELGKEGDEYDIKFTEEKCDEFIFKVARLVLRHHGDKIRKIGMHDEMVRMDFF